MKLDDIENMLRRPNLRKSDVDHISGLISRYKDRLIEKQDRLHEIESQLAIIASQLYEPRTLDELIRNLENKHQKDTLYKLTTRHEDARIYLSDYDLNVQGSKNVRAIFNVLGSIRNDVRETYQIKLFYPMMNEKGSFSCNCPDHKFNSSKKKIVCKHICFLLCRVAKILDTRFFETKQLTEEQFTTFLSRIDNKKKILDDRSLCKTSTRPVFNNTTKELSDDDQCPICFEEMTLDSVVSCPTCTNYVHKQCILVWLEKNSTCVYCRSKDWKQYRPNLRT